MKKLLSISAVLSMLFSATPVLAMKKVDVVVLPSKGHARANVAEVATQVTPEHVFEVDDPDPPPPPPPPPPE